MWLRNMLSIKKWGNIWKYKNNIKKVEVDHGGFYVLILRKHSIKGSIVI